MLAIPYFLRQSKQYVISLTMNRRNKKNKRNGNKQHILLRANNEEKNESKWNTQNGNVNKNRVIKLFFYVFNSGKYGRCDLI